MTETSNKEIARAIYELTKDKVGAEQHSILKVVVNFLYRKQLFSKAADILMYLEKIVNQTESRTSVAVSSARPLGEHTKHKLAQILKKRYSTREIAFHPKLDDSLQGGLRLEANNEVIDLSLKYKIRKLEEFLTRPA
jgi:ATP synthase F1 delta subunit